MGALRPITPIHRSDDIESETSSHSASYADVVELLDSALARRARSFPVRDATYAQVVGAVEALFERLGGSKGLPPRKPPDSGLERFRKFAHRPVFICGSMKSGTTLLSQLLDDHPELVVIPGDSHYIRNAPKWRSADFRTIGLHWLQRMVNPTGQPPFWFLGRDRETLKRFLRHLRYLLRQPGLEAFQAVVGAVYLSGPLKPEGIRYWVEKTPHNELQARTLFRKFPQAQFIHMVRNPLPNLASLKKIDRRCGWNRSVLEHGSMLQMLLSTGRKNRRILGPARYHILRYEDLVSHPESMMKGVCRFLGLSFDDTLLRPTCSGKAATSNSMYAEAVVVGRILDQGRKRRYVRELTREELAGGLHLLNREAKRHGYDLRNETRDLVSVKGSQTRAKSFLQAWRTAFRVRLDLALEERQKRAKPDSATGKGRAAADAHTKPGRLCCKDRCR